MCETCIRNLQDVLDEEMLKPIPGRILIHLDDDPDEGGVILNKEQVEAGLHDSMNPECWCHPISIEPSDTRTAEEIWNDAAFQHDAVV